jgi:hypothetical protein
VDIRRAAAILALLCVAAASAAGLANGLASCGLASRPRAGTVPVSPAQVKRLASVRYGNYQDGRSGLRATLGPTGAAAHLTGWIDWRQPLIYLSSVGATLGAADGLVQAVPGAVAVRPPALAGTPAPATASGTAAATDLYPAPPPVPPADGWRVRQTGATRSPFDTLVALLFTMSAPQPDDPALIAGTGARFVRRDAVGGVPVDVLDGPPLPPRRAPSVGAAGPRLRPAASPSVASVPFTASGGQVTYWVDDAGRVRRLDALIGRDLPVRVDFARTDRTVPVTIELLGGAPVTPRPVTAAEAQALARVRLRDRVARGGQVSVIVPVTGGALVRADGWLDWRTPAVYLAVRDLDNPSQDCLILADRYGVTVRAPATPAPGTVPSSPHPTPGVATAVRPPLPPPADGWRLTAWNQRNDPEGAIDLDILLNEALLASSASQDDPAELRNTASWLRMDTLAGAPVTVYEIRKPVESAVAPGSGRLRYWVDGSGVLRRLELRTRTGAFGYLDLVPGTVPALSSPRT